MQTVYVETSVISHAAARLSRVSRVAVLQHEDALHVASAAIGGVNYLVTQNFAHIANAVTIRTIYGVLDRLGLGPLLICTPAEFLGGLDDGQE